MSNIFDFEILNITSSKCCYFKYFFFAIYICDIFNYYFSLIFFFFLKFKEFQLSRSIFVINFIFVYNKISSLW